MKMKNSMVTIVLVMGLLGIQAQNVGETAPDFSLEKLDGGTFTLSEHIGNVVFVFIFGSECTLCIFDTSPKVKSDILSAYASNNSFVAIGIDSWNKSNSVVQSFKSKTGLDIPLLLQGQSVASSYSSAHDRFLVIDKKGVLVYKGSVAGVNDIGNVKAAIENALAAPVAIQQLDMKPENSIRHFPNPVTDHATIQMDLIQGWDLKLTLHDITGRKVKDLFEGYMENGTHNVELHTHGLAGGIYFYKLAIGQEVIVGKMVVE
jgi:peroxiredoxin